MYRARNLYIDTLSVHKGGGTVALNSDFDKLNFNELQNRNIGPDANYDLGNIYSNHLFLLSLKSQSIFLENNHKTILRVFSYKNPQDFFYNLYFDLKKLYFENNCQPILFLGGDVIFRKPAYYNDNHLFEMINYADAKKDFTSRVKIDSNFKVNTNFEHYFNADIRLFGSNLDEQVFKIGDHWAGNWQNYWEYEQDLYNAMYRYYWESDKKFTLQKSDLAYQLPIDEIENKVKLKLWNAIDFDDAKVVHLHSSRNAKKAYEFAFDLLRL